MALRGNDWSNSSFCFNSCCNNGKSRCFPSYEIKKVLAYSTGSQICYMMMVLGIAGLSQQFVNGYTAGFFHLISHAMFKASLFMAAGSLLHVVGSRFMTDMGGLRKNMKKT